MNRFTQYGILLYLFFSMSLLYGQSDYYWSGRQKFQLKEDRQSIAIHFETKQNEDQLAQSLAKLTTLSNYEYHPFAQRLILEFNENQSLTTIQRYFSTGTKSIAYARQLPDGFRVWRTHQVVFQPKSNVELDRLSEFWQEQKATIQQSEFGYYSLDVADIQQVTTVANQLYESGLVAWAHPDFYAKKTLYNDPLYGEQFQMNNTGQVIDRFQSLADIDCNAPEAWNITTGDPNLIVAVIDDGVEAHEDLVTANGTTRVLRGFSPANNGDGTPDRTGAHGQSCAGIVAASHNNVGVRGVAPEVQILPINIFIGGESTSQLADAISFASTNGAAVISNSWGYDSCEGRFDVFDAAVREAAQNGRGGKGCIITFASGNSFNTCVEYPANLLDVIAVGAVTNQGERSNYSNFGTSLDLVAPSNGAAGVRTIDRMGGLGYDGRNYTRNFGGTSAACPVVSGVAALVISAAPELSASAIKNILYTSAKDLGQSGRDNEYGHGLVDAFAALQIALTGEQAGYCISRGESVQDEWIAGFEIGNYANSSSRSVYSDFTNEVIKLTHGSTYSLSITPGFSAEPFEEVFSVWIDYNQNEQFEENELVFSAGPTSESVTGTITIPVGLVGTTRMRVSQKYQTASTACEIFAYGEVEDYTIEFSEDDDNGGNVETSACNAPTNLIVSDIADNSATFAWEEVAGAERYEFRVRVLGGTWIDFNDLTEASIGLTNFTVGSTYDAQVRAICVDDVPSDYTPILTFEFTLPTTSYCEARGENTFYEWIDYVELNELVNESGRDEGYGDYTNLNATVERNSSPTIRVSKGSNFNYTVEWSIYIDFNQNNIFEEAERLTDGSSDSNNILEGTFDVPANAKLGSTRMRIVMRDDGGSDPCGSFEFGEVEDYTVQIVAPNPSLHSGIASTNTTALAELTTSIELYPNPTSDWLFVQLPSLNKTTTIELYNQLGQLIQTIPVQDTIEKIEVQHLASGIYFLKIEEEVLEWIKQ